MLQASLKETMRAYKADAGKQGWRVQDVDAMGTRGVAAFTATCVGCDERWTIRRIARRALGYDLLWEPTAFMQSPRVPETPRRN